MNDDGKKNEKDEKVESKSWKVGEIFLLLEMLDPK